MAEDRISDLDKPVIRVNDLNILDHFCQRRIGDLRPLHLIVVLESIYQHQLQGCLRHQLQNVRIQVLRQIILEPDIVVSVCADHALRLDRVNERDHVFACSDQFLHGADTIRLRKF